MSEADLSTTWFIDVTDGEKHAYDHTQRPPDDPQLSGNYGVYAGRGANSSGDEGYLVDIGVDYHGDNIDTDALAAVEGLPATLTVASPHTSADAPDHRYYAVVGDDLGARISDTIGGAVNPTLTWGEIRVQNQLTVGPGSQLDGCSKDWCNECATPNGGYYRIAGDRPIATITVEDLLAVIRADPNYTETAREYRSSDAQTKKSNGTTAQLQCISVANPTAGDTDTTFTTEAGVPLAAVRSRDENGAEKLDALLRTLNPTKYAYPSRSEADLAATSLLWHRGFTSEAIGGILRAYRPYEKTRRDDYLTRIVSTAISGTTRAFTDDRKDTTDCHHYTDDDDHTSTTPAISVAIDGRSPSAIWTALATTEPFQDAVIDAIRERADGLTTTEFTAQLDEIGADALNGLWTSLCVRIARGEQAAVWKLLQITAMFGRAQTPIGGIPTPLEAITAGPLAVLDATSTHLTITVSFEEGFRDQRASQRRDICWLLSALAESCALQIDLEPDDQDLADWVTTQHRHDLPGVSEYVMCSRSDDDAIALAGAALGDGVSRTHWRVLDALQAAHGHEATYYRLFHYDRLPVSNSRIRQVLDELRNHQLVYTEGPDADKRASLTAAGEIILNHRNREFGREQTLDAFVSSSSAPLEDPPNRRDNIRVPPSTLCSSSSSPSPPAADKHDGSRDANDNDSWISIECLSRHEHAAIAAGAPTSGIGLSDHPIEDTGKHPLFSYDTDHDEVIVGATFGSALQYMVCIARALAGGQMWQHVLTPDRLTANVDLNEFGDRVRWIQCSQGGWCSKHERTASDYIARLQAALTDICAATSRYCRLTKNDEHDAADACASAIIRDCHGLVGTISWLLDACGVTLVRAMYVPEYASDWHTSENHRRRRHLLRTITKLTTITAKYGAYTAERTMYEPRPHKREFVLGAPNVTPAEPYGSLIGRLTIIGTGIENLVDPADGPSLPAALAAPGELQEEASNYTQFAAPITLRSDRARAAVREAVDRMCTLKNLRPTAAAISAFTALCGSIFDVTRALQYLGAEPANQQRAIRLDEVRSALARVPASRLLPDHGKPSLGRVLRTLLVANNESLSQRALAEQANVTTQTIRNNVDILTALSIVERTDRGSGHGYDWRCTLPTRTERDTEQDAVPWQITERTDAERVAARDRQPARSTAVHFEDIIAALALQLDNTGLIDDRAVEPPNPTQNEKPSDPCAVASVSPDGTTTRSPLVDLCDHHPTLSDWLPIAAALTGTDLSILKFDANGNAIDAVRSQTVSIGTLPEQASL